MTRYVRKVHCPGGTHADSRPSCAVYTDGSGFCFTCNQYFADIAEAEEIDTPKEKEDLDAKLSYINALPTDSIRGLVLHFDNSGYYILWPNSNYYKLRVWNDRRGDSRYISPIGHSKPVFRLDSENQTQNLIIVEGEINALSINSIKPNSTIISPGSASSFVSKEIKNIVKSLENYANILICVDNDAAGLQGALGIKSLLDINKSNIEIKLLEKDFNDLLVNYEKDFKEKIKALGMPSWVSSN